MRAVFFSLASWQVVLVILAIVGGATFAGYTIGRYLREHSETLSEPFGVMQGASSEWWDWCSPSASRSHSGVMRTAEPRR